ncbi:MAG: CPBP family intramembrane metalloprotease [Eggerthellales bacterium]|nr:CPBP family intramembrane metalloprotease [Eggerthellales bacterium]
MKQTRQYQVVPRGDEESTYPAGGLQPARASQSTSAPQPTNMPQSEGALQDKSRIRILMYLVITFVLTWGYCFLVVYPAAGFDLQATLSGNGPFGSGATALSSSASMLLAPAMFFPAIGVVFTRILTKEGFAHSMIRPVHFAKTWKWWVVAWFLPSILIMVGGVVYFVIFPSDLGFFESATHEAMVVQYQQAVGGELSDQAYTGVVIGQLVLGALLAPVINLLTCFGEEWGWRGYLLPKLLGRFRVVPTLLITGVIWGVWHAPMTVLGHNFGVGYPGWPWLGIAAMCLFCTCAGVLLGFVTLRTGSCLAAAIGHGAFNGFGAAAMLFSVSGGNPFVGPGITGLAGGCALTVTAVVLLWVLHKQERDGVPLLTVPETGAAR